MRDKTNPESDTDELTTITGQSTLPPDVGHEPWPLRYQLFIRDHNHVGALLILLACCLGMVFYIFVRVQLAGRLIDVDRAQPTSATYIVDINSADWPEIANLPGIGPKLAAAVVDYRKNNGPFESHDELEDVSGIGPAKLANLRPFLAPIRAPFAE